MTRFERWSVWLSTAATLVTGLVYWWMKDMMTPTSDWSVINHPLQPWVLKAHILVAPFLVFSVGLITTRHIWNHYRVGVKKGRKSGLITALIIVPMVLTGYLLQVFTGETLVRVLGWAHLGLGIIYSVGLAAHWPATRRSNGVAAKRIQPRDSDEARVPGRAMPKGTTADTDRSEGVRRTRDSSRRRAG